MHPLAAALLDIDPTTTDSPLQAAPSLEVLPPAVPTQNTWDNVPNLHGTKPPTVEYATEKPIHRVMAYMLAKGMTQIEVAKATGYSVGGVAMVAKQVWFRQIVAKIVHEEQKDGLQELLRAGAVDAVESIKELARGAKSETVKLAASNSLLDRIMGKAVPVTEDSTPDVPIDPAAELKQIDEELERLTSQ